jgi:hypothetical protein
MKRWAPHSKGEVSTNTHFFSSFFLSPFFFHVEEKWGKNFNDMIPKILRRPMGKSHGRRGWNCKLS